MKIADILCPDAIVGNSACHSKKDALDTLARLLAATDPGLGQGEIFDCLIARERLGSTGLGQGIAIPHGRLKEQQRAIAAFLRLARGVDYAAPDGRPVDLLFALIVPEQSTEAHLQILARLAEMFSAEAMLRRLRRARSAEALYAILTG